jgi:hypothetical protein
MTADIPQDAIELRVDKIAQLFHSLDAEDYIVGWARELDRDQPITIVVHVPDGEARSKEAMELQEAFAHYFSYRAESLQRELKELFRVGRRSLVIGMTVLAACLLSAHFCRRAPVQPAVPPAGRREPAHSRLGRQLAADRDLHLRLVADRAPAQSLPPLGRGHGRDQGLSRQAGAGNGVAQPGLNSGAI